MVHDVTDHPAFADILARHGLTGAPETPLDHDGWSGARLSRIDRGPGYVVKRDSLEWDWIARATADGPTLREAWFAVEGPSLTAPLWAPYLGAGLDGDIAALLMPDLTGTLLPWEEVVDRPSLGRVLEAMVALHRTDVPDRIRVEGPWCPLRERLLLLSRPAAEVYRAEDNLVGERFLAGWDAFARLADPAAVDLIDRLSTDPTGLIDALGRLPTTLIHGDLKLGNVGPAADGRVAIVDWQMVAIAPVAVELGWFLVSNVASLSIGPEAVLAAYRSAALAAGDGTNDETWRTQVDLAWLVGLVLRGWRKGLDAAASAVHPTGLTAEDDLASWSAGALAAADRRL